MGKREILVGLLLGGLALGGATMIEFASTLFPNHAQLLFYIGAGCVVVAIVGLAILFFWPRKPAPIDGAAIIDQSVSSTSQSGGTTAWSVGDRDRGNKL